MQKTSFYLGLLSFSVLFSTFAHAEKGIYFSHQNWEIACDNVGTCQAAGYQADDGDMPASILLTRKAGAKQAVTAEFVLSTYEQQTPAQAKSLKLYSNHIDLGQVNLDSDDGELITGKLSSKQVQALLANSQQRQNIEFKNAGQQQWQISDLGMTAVLLKMDDVQKRVGTTGALIKKGTASEKNVLKAKALPIIHYVKIDPKLIRRIQPEQPEYQKLAQILFKSLKDPESCEVIIDGDQWHTDAREPIHIARLTADKVLVSTFCWRGAYNEGYGYWVMNKNLTGPAENVTTSASDFDQGIIYSSQKGRGIGDCWSIAQWVWNGQKFVQSEDYWTGMCKGIAAGGIWELKQISIIVK
ncbi:DUF1176 domain-containing protein [Acinetobacter puyangensis]|uniref:DUF1176 domain-containing protein n=1 Tax=Acinetobacter puyangensis TaxID=1096779 RepID=A0A240E5L6_9GAMM|nr:DUF1176 domain-containing protein [Acinetobacter puyangensis]SNX43553.1 Protein of unknown function [Acinetobacter puyangensis]